MPKVRLIRGDATQPWPVEDNSLDSIVTDPPYGIEFMGEEWDKFHEDKGIWRNRPQIGGFANSPRLPRFSVQDIDDKIRYQEWTTAWAKEAYRTLKPGGFLLAFGSPRMVHRMAVGIEEAGFRIVDTIEWLYLTGFPKAQDIGKMFDKRAGTERAVIGRARRPIKGTEFHAGAKAYGRKDEYDITAPATPLAKKWDGWKTPSLKPAHEPIIMAQKPLDGTYIENIERWGVGAINVEACRFPTDDDLNGGAYSKNKKDDGKWGTLHRYVGRDFVQPSGRFPANVVTLDEDEWYSRYFNITPRELSKKASPAERKGDGWRNNHPTVKPVELVRWLQRLVTPPGGTTMSPFLGSGTDAVAAVLEGFDFIGMDVSDEYWPIVYGRLNDLAKTVEFALVDEEVHTVS